MKLFPSRIEGNSPGSNETCLFLTSKKPLTSSFLRWLREEVCELSVLLKMLICDLGEIFPPDSQSTKTHWRLLSYGFLIGSLCMEHLWIIPAHTCSEEKFWGTNPFTNSSFYCSHWLCSLQSCFKSNIASPEVENGTWLWWAKRNMAEKSEWAALRVSGFDIFVWFPSFQFSLFILGNEVPGNLESKNCCYLMPGLSVVKPYSSMIWLWMRGLIWPLLSKSGWWRRTKDLCHKCTHPDFKLRSGKFWGGEGFLLSYVKLCWNQEALLNAIPYL